MSDKHSKIHAHYQKLQECLTELVDPGFMTQTRSFMLITLNQTYTSTENLFELVEESANLSKSRQATLARLANHIENTKERGIGSDFIAFIDKDLRYSLAFIRELFDKDFELAS